VPEIGFQMIYEHIIVSTQGAVGLIQLNRPKALNALSAAMIVELNLALDGFERDAGIGAIILTGNEKAFAAGADIREMKDKTYADMKAENFLHNWDHIITITKPIIAAVAGFALGGGCEYALTCDMIIAADTAKFSLPETGLGIIPGLGGTQRLVRAVGKAKAMDMILTQRMIDAVEAERAGLVSRIVPADQLFDEALKIATKIAGLSHPIVKAAKQVVNAAAELPLSAGLKQERDMFHLMFDLADQKEGMAAFLEKRPAKFENR
jgi:enoyl-CoA hydratase